MYANPPSIEIGVMDSSNAREEVVLCFGIRSKPNPYDENNEKHPKGVRPPGEGSNHRFVKSLHKNKEWHENHGFRQLNMIGVKPE